MIAIVTNVFLAWLATGNRTLRAAIPQHNRLDAFPADDAYLKAIYLNTTDKKDQRVKNCFIWQEYFLHQLVNE